MGKKIWECALILAVLPFVVAPGIEAPRRTVSGNISLSASPTGTRTYVSLALPFDARVNASVPLSLDSEKLSSSSLTARGAVGGLNIAAGKLKISDAASFLARPDLVSCRGSPLLYSANLGSASDPLGVSVDLARFSLFLTKGNLYTCGSAQYLLSDRAGRLAISVGALLAEGNEASVMSRLSPWLAIGTGYCAPDISCLARFQIYPDFETGHNDFFSLSWLKAAACRLDILWRSSRQNIKGFLYVETGDFVSATGQVAGHDAMAQIDYEADISFIPLVKDFSVHLSAFSKQGAAEPAAVATPSWGAFPNYLALKYWPDGGEISFSIKNKEKKAAILSVPIFLDSSLSGTAAKKTGGWLGKIGFDLDVRSAKMAMIQLGGSFELKTSFAEEESASDGADDTFSDISAYEESEDTTTTQNTDSIFRLDRALIVLRAIFSPISCRVSADLPLGTSDSGVLRVQLRVSAKMPHFFLEASGTGDFTMREQLFSMASAHVYVKIPL